MVEPTGTNNQEPAKFTVKYFDLDGDNNYVQLEAVMTEEEHQLLLAGESGTTGAAI